jgi:hypothetical protein
MPLLGGSTVSKALHVHAVPIGKYPGISTLPRTSWVHLTT